MTTCNMSLKSIVYFSPIYLVIYRKEGKTKETSDNVTALSQNSIPEHWLVCQVDTYSQVL